MKKSKKTKLPTRVSSSEDLRRFAGSIPFDPTVDKALADQRIVSIKEWQ